ncbi:MAG: serine/threonine protein kinase [Bdellovibrionaceae bacterium]|nr:serine/threonine protein kinase [Pseudobdellovibrionaceae bacterium]
MKYQKIGPYILLQKIASGGMADIFLAKKTGPNNLNSFYAIKKILEKYAKMPEFHKMFHEEAKITNALSLDIHKNVMTSAVYEKLGNHYIFVMEYIKGLNLKHFLKLAEQKDSPLNIGAILYVIAEIASGLDHLHSLVNLKTGQPLKLIHRDISPQNVMISHNGQIKIIDFGIAKASILEETQADAGIKGKMAYMSPEQAAGSSLDSRSDIFSLGIMLWELLAKKRLFLADSTMATLRNVRNCQIPDIRTFNPNIPPEIEQVLKRSLAKKPEDRYKNAISLAQDLYKIIQSKENFSSYDFEHLTKKVYADDIVKNRRLLAKYMNISADGDSAVDITYLGLDHDKIDKEKTQDLSTSINTTEQRSKINKVTNFSNTAAAANKQADITLNLSPVTYAKIQSRQKHLMTVKHNTSVAAAVPNKPKLNNVPPTYRQPKSFQKPAKNSPFFGIVFSASLAIAGFFLFSSVEQQNVLLNKVAQIKNSFITKPKAVQNNILTPPIAQNIAAPVIAEASLSKPAESDNSPTLLTYIHTKPAGVEIFVNDKPISISPSNIVLPKNKTVKITLKKYKYHTKEFKINTNLLLTKRRAPASVNSKIIINKQEVKVILQKKYSFNDNDIIQ